jgi:peptide chain release factor 1
MVLINHHIFTAHRLFCSRHSLKYILIQQKNFSCFNACHNSILNPSIETDLLNIKIEKLHPALLEKAKSLKNELNDLELKISNGSEFNIIENKKYSNLISFVSIYNEFLNLNENYNELINIINNENGNEDDLQLIDDAKIELSLIIHDLIKFTNKLKIKLLPQHPFADKSTILELRPGAGGHEANIFTNDLLNMYIKYCQFNNWKYEILSKTDHISGSGIIDATLLINFNGSYDRLRNEAGVHRVQRIPTTETKGRVHTSASGVVVLPKIDDDENSNNLNLRKFKPDELKIDVMRASGSGGQHVNTTESAVRITHLPTGIVVSIQDERSQHKNKEKALTVLKARLAEKELREKREKERNERTSQVSSVDRSDKIRTYNFQQNRVTDHRCNFTLYDLEGCLNGTKLDLIIDQVEKKETDDLAIDLIKELEEKN